MVWAGARAHARPSAVKVTKVCRWTRGGSLSGQSTHTRSSSAGVHLVGDPRVIGAPAKRHGLVRAWRRDSERTNRPPLS
eukprot:scaffold25825_cov61-Phaeocystis_antarctica.AAC.1